MDEKVAIVTDTIGCISEEEKKKYNITEVPVRIIFGNKVYRDRVDLKADEFYAMFGKTDCLPTTSAPSPEHFFNAYRERSREAKNVLCITLSSKLSGTFNSAKLAAEIAKETIPGVNVEVLDSQTAAAAEGFVVLAAAKAAALGRSLADVVSAAKKIMNRVNLLAIVDTLYYLSKGGRVPKVAAWAGAILKIKPILTIKEGEARLAANARTSLGAMKRMLDIMKNKIVKGTGLHVAVMHAAETEKAAELKKQISASFDCTELLVTEFTPVMGAHTGPGVIGIAFYNEEC